jgi:hypothetical protein
VPPSGSFALSGEISNDRIDVLLGHWRLVHLTHLGDRCLPLIRVSAGWVSAMLAEWHDVQFALMTSA